MYGRLGIHLGEEDGVAGRQRHHRILPFASGRQVKRSRCSGWRIKHVGGHWGVVGSVVAAGALIRSNEQRRPPHLSRFRVHEILCLGHHTGYLVVAAGSILTWANIELGSRPVNPAAGFGLACVCKCWPRAVVTKPGSFASASIDARPPSRSSSQQVIRSRPPRWSRENSWWRRFRFRGSLRLPRHGSLCS